MGLETALGSSLIRNSNRKLEERVGVIRLVVGVCWHLQKERKAFHSIVRSSPFFFPFSGREKSIKVVVVVVRCVPLAWFAFQETFLGEPIGMPFLSMLLANYLLPKSIETHSLSPHSRSW